MIDVNAPVVQMLQQVTLLDIIKVYFIYVAGSAAIGVALFIGFVIWMKRKLR